MKKNIKRIIFSIITVTAFILTAMIAWNYPLVIRLAYGIRMYSTSNERLKFYALTNGKNIQDITAKLTQDKSIPYKLRSPLLSGERRILIFKYKSDNNDVAGYFSYLTNGTYPLIIFLRGGNGKFGIMRPNNQFSFIDGYNILGTLYRGNIYGGSDELSGNDIRDVENLIKFIPALQKFSGKTMKPPYKMLGVSRGATQMFGSLAHSTLVSNSVNKAISISGAVDLYTQMHKRADMKFLFKHKFKNQNKFTTLNSWLDYRNPVSLAQYLNPSLKVLLIHGQKDRRVSIDEQKSFIHELKKYHISNQYIEIPGTGHNMDGAQLKLWKYIREF